MICDTDPLKLHYVWSLWRTGHASHRQWRAELNETRQLFTKQRLGIADLILIQIPGPAVLAARRQADRTRRRRNFDLHIQLADLLRDWYHAVEQLDPPRVRWELPRNRHPRHHPRPPRQQHRDGHLRRTHQPTPRPVSLDKNMGTPPRARNSAASARRVTAGWTS